MKEIYIAFVDTTGIFARLIQKFLKQRYVHVVISADPMLEDAYSVGRRWPAIPVLAGFEKEDKQEILQVFPEAYYLVCAVKCTDMQKNRLMEQLHKDYHRRFRIHYAVCGLPFIVLGIPFFLKNQYTCSSYLARLLEENGILTFEKHFSLVTPRDFLERTDMEKIFEGNLSEFAYGT